MNDWIEEIRKMDKYEKQKSFIDRLITLCDIYGYSMHANRCQDIVFTNDKGEEEFHICEIDMYNRIYY